MQGKLFICALITLLCYGCVTKREVITEVHTDTIRISNTDTIRQDIYHTDTLKDYKIIQKTDTIREIVTKTITLKESGDTIREVVNNNVYKYVYQKDSTDKYQSKIDSLKQKIAQIQNEKEIVTNDKEKEVVVTKKNTWRNPLLIAIMAICVLILFWYRER